MAEKVDLGFAEFVAKLVSETLDAVVTATVDQEERLAALTAAAALTLEEYASEHVDDDAVRRALEEAFPADGEHPAGVTEGTPYRRADGELPERPALHAVLGIEVGPRDVRKTDDGLVVTRALADRVARVVREGLAAEGWSAARALAARGLPRVVVDSGRIVAKQTLTVERPDPGQPAPPPVPVGPRRGLPFGPRGVPGILGPRSVLGSPFEPRLLPDVVLRVRPADDRAPQSTTSGTVYGEVEITFKTVQ